MTKFLFKFYRVVPVRDWRDHSIIRFYRFWRTKATITAPNLLRARRKLERAERRKGNHRPFAFDAYEWGSDWSGEGQWHTIARHLTSIEHLDDNTVKFSTRHYVYHR